MIRRYSEEKHQSLWGAVCDYMREAGCPINEQEAVPELFRKYISTGLLVCREFQCGNGTRFIALADESGNGAWHVSQVIVKGCEEDEE